MRELQLLLHATSGYVAGTASPFCRVLTTCQGHPQQEHETRHGSMSRTRWTVDGPDDVPLEIEGRKFSTNDEGAPMMCNLICSAMGRHVHIDYCRATDEAACTGNEELQHLSKRLQPDPDRPKDTLTHSLFWKRSGERGSHTFSLADFVLYRFQGSLLERRTGQLCEMVRFCFAHYFWLSLTLTLR